MDQAHRIEGIVVDIPDSPAWLRTIEQSTVWDYISLIVLLRTDSTPMEELSGTAMHSTDDIAMKNDAEAASRM